MIARHRLEQIVAHAIGLKVGAARIAIRPPLDFQSNRLYDVWVNGRHLIAKEFLKPDEWADAPAREFRALQLLQPLDIAPHPVYYDPGAAPIVVYAFMEGEMWDRKRPSAGELAQLAKLWLRMQAVPVEGLWASRGHNESLAAVEAQIQDSFQRYAEWTAVNFPQGECSAARCLDLLARFRSAAGELAGQRPVFSFCRADQRFANVIRRPDGRLGWVDWEDSGLRDPARDLADLITHPNQEDLLDMDAWRPFLAPYLAARSRFDATIDGRFHAYLALFPIYWLALLLDHGRQKVEQGTAADWHINGLPANERLRRYLARALAGPDTNFQRQLAALDSLAFF